MINLEIQLLKERFFYNLTYASLIFQQFNPIIKYISFNSLKFCDIELCPWNFNAGSAPVWTSPICMKTIPWLTHAIYSLYLETDKPKIKSSGMKSLNAK